LRMPSINWQKEKVPQDRTSGSIFHKSTQRLISSNI